MRINEKVMCIPFTYPRQLVNAHVTSIYTTAMNTPSPLQSELNALERAFNTQALYIIGKESLKIGAQTGFAKRMVLRLFLFIRENTRSKVANLRVPVEKVVEVGFVKDM